MDYTFERTNSTPSARLLTGWMWRPLRWDNLARGLERTLGSMTKLRQIERKMVPNAHKTAEGGPGHSFNEGTLRQALLRPCASYCDV
jgi:hypothetical protein